jgi:hypothetical protein
MEQLPGPCPLYGGEAVSIRAEQARERIRGVVDALDFVPGISLPRAFFLGKLKAAFEGKSAGVYKGSIQYSLR